MSSERTSSKTAVKAFNSMARTKAIKLHGSAYTEAGTPDILCICFDLPFLIEMKKQGGVLSKLQELRLRQWKDAGANTRVCYSAEEAILCVLVKLTLAERAIILKQEVRQLEPIILRVFKSFR